MAIRNPVITGMTPDTGTSATDGITNVSVVTLRGTSKPQSVVTVFDNGIVVGTATTDRLGAWTLANVTLTAGTNLLTATFDTGLGVPSAVSPTFTATLDTQAPSVTVHLTTDTGANNHDNITSIPTLSGVGDPNSIVTIKQGATILGTATTGAAGAWTFTPAGLSLGAHTVTVTQTDVAGNTGTAQLTFTLVASAFTVTSRLVSDTGASGTDKITSDPALTGTGAANITVTIKEGATVLGTTTSSATGAWSFTPVGLTDGVHTIDVIETDGNGNTGSTSLTFTLDTLAPPVTLTLANDTGIIAFDLVTRVSTLAGTADPNASVVLTENGMVLGTAFANAAGVWQFTPPGILDGIHTIVATGTDAAGNTASAQLTYTLDTTSPVATIRLANDTGSSATDTITSDPALKGTGEPGAAITVTEGGIFYGIATVDASGNWTFGPTGMPDGVHTVLITETDLAGNVSTATLTFTLDTTAPVLTEQLANDAGVSATDRLTAVATLTGSGDANGTVTLMEGATTLGMAVAGANGVWTFAPAGLADGVHTIVATQTDAAGHSTSATLTYTLETRGPAGWFFTAPVGSNFDGLSAIAAGTVIGSVTGFGDPTIGDSRSYYFATDATGAGAAQTMNGLTVDQSTGSIVAASDLTASSDRKSVV